MRHLVGSLGLVAPDAVRSMGRTWYWNRYLGGRYQVESKRKVEACVH